MLMNLCYYVYYNITDILVMQNTIPTFILKIFQKYNSIPCPLDVDYEF